jgi:hypothetical protein
MLEQDQDAGEMQERGVVLRFAFPPDDQPT